MLWAFGCSNTYGFSLGTSFSVNKFIKKYPDNDDRKSLWHQKVAKVQHKSSTLSWPARLAEKLKTDVTNLSEVGSGLDKCITNLQKIESKINWDNDIVVIGMPKIFRYFAIENNHVQLSNTIPMGAPATESLELFYQAMVTYLETNYPKVKLIRIYKTKDALESTPEINFFNTHGLNHFEVGLRYPCGHYNEETHECFAEYLSGLIMELNNENRTRH